MPRTTSRLVLCMCIIAPVITPAAELKGTVIDAAGEHLIAARVYVYDAHGKHFHVKCEGATVAPYDRRRSGTSLEIHTTIPAAEFQVDLPPGEYTVEVEKGKEYFPASQKVVVSDSQPSSVTIPLKRWTNMAAKGWFSGETHVHREVEELPVLQTAEDINIAFPLTAWVTDSLHTPATHNKNTRVIPPARLVAIDKSHVYWPVNTEYEIFTVRGKRHTLGAVFVLNHKRPLTMPAPPVAPIATEARKQGAFLELDKHNWPWSMMLVPQMEVDLFELTNNHLWRTEFLYSDWYPEYAADYMNIEMKDGQFTERGWIDFGFKNYYALLNCGFTIKPTAGTASGVHPVPFGFGRVYVRLEDGFDYNQWVAGLLSGNSFVTTGPMLTVTVDKNLPDGSAHIVGQLESSTLPISVEVIVNGKITQTIDIPPVRTNLGAYRVPIDTDVHLDGSSWVAVRAFTKREGDRISFAHTAPAHFEVEGKPLRPSKNQRDYLAKRVRDEIARSRPMLSREALREFEDALKTFESFETTD